MKYHFKIYPEKDNGYWAKCIELPGCITEGNSMEELQLNMQEALNLYLDEPADSVDLAPLPDDKIKKFKNIIEVPVDPSIALAFLIRYNRLKLGFTQKEVANLMGFKQLYSYQRLEEGRENPSLKTLVKIKEVFPDLSIDLALNV